MFTKALLLALAASPLVSAHGKVAVVTGDAGGNGTALGIMGAVVPGPGPNRKTEVDTTVFKKVNGKAVTMSDGLGRTNGNGQNKMSMMSMAMAQSGNTLPQVTDGGSISGVFHVVTTDGAGPLEAVIDPTATGAFSKGTMLKVDQQIEGNNGNIKATKKGKRSLPEKLWDRALDALEARGILLRRAANVNRDFNMKFSIPAGTQCTGTVAGQQNVCLVKIANTNKAGPFGGVVAVQMVGAGGAAAAAPAATPAAGAATGAATGASNTKTDKAAKGAKAGKAQNRRAVGFSA